jgi:hypothetical protein
MGRVDKTESGGTVYGHVSALSVTPQHRRKGLNKNAKNLVAIMSIYLSVHRMALRLKCTKILVTAYTDRFWDTMKATCQKMD